MIKFWHTKLPHVFTFPLVIWEFGEWLLIDSLLWLGKKKKKEKKEALSIIIAQHSQLFSSRWEGLQWADTLKNAI